MTPAGASGPSDSKGEHFQPHWFAQAANQRQTWNSVICGGHSEAMAFGPDLDTLQSPLSEGILLLIRRIWFLAPLISSHVAIYQNSQELPNRVSK